MDKRSIYINPVVLKLDKNRHFFIVNDQKPWNEIHLK